MIVDLFACSAVAEVEPGRSQELHHSLCMVQRNIMLGRLDLRMKNISKLELKREPRIEASMRCELAMEQLNMIHHNHH